jgi:hypothetical protein
VVGHANCLRALIKNVQGLSDGEVRLLGAGRARAGAWAGAGAGAGARAGAGAGAGAGVRDRTSTPTCTRALELHPSCIHAPELS